LTDAFAGSMSEQSASGIAGIAVAVGKFDALHVGHRALVARAAQLGTPCLLRLTGLAEAFGWPARMPLIAEDDRSRVLADWPGNPREIAADIRELRGLDAGGFVDWLVRTRHSTALVVGADFRCGRGRSAGVAELAPLCLSRGMTLTVVDPIQVSGQPASSSRVRAALAEGDVLVASACLGRPHRLVGTVERGDGRGRTIGFPTANLGLPRCQVPGNGVYAARAWLDGRSWPAAVNIGVLPTIGDARALTVEAHLIGFVGECYGSDIGLDLLGRIRAEQRFASLDDVRRQIATDVAQVASLVG